MRTPSMIAFASTLFTSSLLFAAQPAPAAAAPSELQTVTAPASSTGGLRFTGWFVTPTYALTSFDGQLTSSPGVRTGVYLNKRFAVGLTGNALFNGDSALEKHEARNLGTYGGVLLQYVVRSDSFVHASVETTLGGGTWCAEVKDTSAGGDDECKGRNFAMAEPVANLEINLARHVRLTTGVGYRFALAGNGTGPGSGDMSGLVARTGVVFGSF